ncbi:class I adenylate-forming enzyme family protein [Novosphingobium sp. Fuku2-ISO-50]|uniref:class I adenylate-forming enzyme family protein n=1 Tax=Novosphingobium sp. Fuku2-ISO-50 TaxID=1739114 RepID=UPI00076DD440|nr:class I adenylate-forming enzyme family protein [Novosphingobium sp. Fuku2-ISO-50]KUR81133.1 AMP-dependent synthetase [Novosphingobium sp. Fuku2-ISO-50]
MTVPSSAQSDPLLAELTGPGMGFEIVEQEGARAFRHAPPDLNLMIESARRHGDRTAIVDWRDDGSERRTSFAEIFAARDRLAAQLGDRRGQRIAICMHNRAEWMIGFLAVLRTGGVAALFNSRGSPVELIAMIEEVTPSLVLADTRAFDALKVGGYAGPMIDLTQPDAAPEPGEGAASGLIAHTASPDDPAAILFTSGTTGRPRGVVLTHRNLVTGLMTVQLSGMMVLHGIAQAQGLPVETILAHMPQQATLLVYPLFHISGLGSGFLSPLIAGTKTIILRRWNPADALRLIADEGVTVLSGVPTMLWDLLRAVEAGGAGGGAGAGGGLASLRNVASGGQALPVNLLDAIRAACPQAMMGTGYGMTECAGALAQAVGADFLRKRASAGRVLPLADVRIVAPDGTVLGPGDTGEIQVRGPFVMQGYWNRPEATAAAFTADGWLRTGDVGFVDDEHYIFIVDRVKDMVISGGENIFCAEVERVLGEQPGVLECAAFGLPDDRLGERLVAVVKGDGVKGDGLDAHTLIEAVASGLARYKAPTEIAIMHEPLPRNVLGKVDKKALRQTWPNLKGEK